MRARPGQIIGYRRNGCPIRLQAGGSGEGGEGQGGAGQGSGNGSGAAGEGGSGDGGGAGGGSRSAGAGDSGTQPRPQFTQDQVDSIVQDRLAREKRKFEDELKQAQAAAGKNETERLTLERDQARQQAERTAKEAAERLALTEAKVAAIQAGAKPERADAVAKNADLSEVIADGEVVKGKIEAAVKKTLKDYPEWLASSGEGGNGSGTQRSGGEMGGGGAPEPTLEEFRDMTYKERTELYGRDAELYRRLVSKDQQARAKGK